MQALVTPFTERAQTAGMPETHLLRELPQGAYRALCDQAPVPMLIVRGHRIRYANAALSELVGYSLVELLSGMTPADLTSLPDRDKVGWRFRQPTPEPRREITRHSQEIECRRRDGSVFPARIWAERCALDGRPADLVTVQDLSETTQVREVAQRRDQLLAQTEELALSGACEYDVATGLVTQSAGMFRIFGEPVSDEPVSGEWLMERVPAAETGFVRAILEGVRPGMPCEFEHRILRSDGCSRAVLHRSMAEADASGRTVRVVSILQDITAQRAAEQQRDRLAQSDAVTGLQNRSSFAEHLDASLNQARRAERPLALLLIQVNQFKLVSDSLGLAGGDQLLAAVGDRMSGLLSTADTLAHLGSGHFALLPSRREGIGEASAHQLAEAVVASFASAFVIGEMEVSATCGIGIALFPRDGDSADKLLHEAQAAMLRALESGDNQICVYAPNAHAKAARRLALQAGLRHALERDEFVLHYQPQLDLSSGRLIGVEALLRWTDSAGQSVSPAEFIPLAEECGLILPIGDWVMRTACAQNVAWQRAGLPPLRMAVNLSMRQLQQPDIARRVQAVLHETGLAARWLGVEITENVLMDESSHVAEMLHAMKAMGVEISLDDFGTGYSNLAYLRTLSIDVVKIDRSFVHDVMAPLQDVSMTRAVITMAHSLHMKVLAEGVETEGQLALLIANRCDQMQGFYFSRPVPADAVAELLRQGRGLPQHLLERRLRPRTLLLVDDEDNILSSLKRLLRLDGYNIVTASSGAQGLQRMAEHPVDVILSDQRMPGMTGVEFLRRAKTLYPDTVRMVLSGYTELQSITDAVNEGAIYKFLTKPWDDERLRSHIEEAFRHKEMVDENRRLAGAVLATNQQLEAVNGQLQQLLSEQRVRITREETSLVVAQDVLHGIPAPLIGIDSNGMVAYLNDDAEALFGHLPSMLGRQATEALPADMRRVWEGGDGTHHPVDLGGRPYQAICRVTPSASRAQARLLVVTPGLAGRSAPRPSTGSP